MFLPNLSIRRPVLTTVGTVAILLLGWIGYRNLPVRELPDVEFPVVSVTTVLPGAAPRVVETEVTEVLEAEINTVEGIKTLTSVSGEGTSVITAEFELGRNIDVALQDVRSKVSRAQAQLPDDVEDPLVQKLDPDAQPIIWVTVQNPDLSLTEVNDFAENTVQERLQTLEGVGSVMIGGAQRFAVRVDMDAQKMAAYGLTVADVRAALQSENVDLPSGRVVSQSREFTVRTEGEFTTPEAFNELILAWRDGAPVRLGDVGMARPGVENERTLARFNGRPTVGVGVVKQSEANTVSVAERVLEEVDAIRGTMPPGYSLTIAVNNAEFVERSVQEVEETIFVAVFLVVAVILLFLRSYRATLVPALAIPVSLVGTFAALHVLGFSINTLTLLGLVITIGIVVDDAIVVVENIYRHIEEGESPLEAARKGTGEIAFAVIAISLTLIIVFLPIAFISGVVGRLFREFGLAVAVSVAISAFVALTLTPMLSSRILGEENPDNAVFRAMERGLDALNEWYRRAIRWSLGHRLLVVLVAVGSLVVSLGLAGVMGKEFVPPEDRGQFLITIQAPEGATLAYTDEYLTRVEEILLETEGVDRFFSAVGLGFGGPPSVNSAIAFVNLAEERDRGQFEIMDEVRRKVRDLAGVRTFLIAPSALSAGGGFEQPVQFVMQARDLERLAAVADSVVARVRDVPGLTGVDTDLDLNKPQLQVTVDRARAASLGVSVAEVATTLQVMLGGRDLSEFERGNERYEVMVQLQEAYRSTPDDLRSIYVRGTGGELVQLANVVSVVEGVGPNQIAHFNRQRAVTLSAGLEGIPLAEGLDRVGGVAADVLPPEFNTAVSGQSQDFQESFGSLVFAMIMAVVAIYLVLAAQFESFIHPFTIMLALPLAVVGAVGALWALGMTLNIYSMIGIIMLQGLVTKNSILLVDYTNTLRERGDEREAAVVRAGVVRLRPIIMTSISIIVGVLPIALALGAGAESRRPLGVAVIFGMLSATVLTLVVVPVFYTLLDDARGRVAAGARRVFRRVRGTGSPAGT